MRLLVVSNLYPPVVFGGYEILCQQVVEALRARGHTIRILTSGFGRESAPTDASIERSLILTTDFPRPGEDVGYVDFRLRSLQRVAQYNRRLTLAALDREPVDLVFCWCLNRLSVGPIFAAQARRVPVVYTINDEHPRQFAPAQPPWRARSLGRALFEKFVWPLATVRALRRFPITTISAALKRRLLAHGLPFEHAEVIHQGVQLARLPFRPAVRRADVPLRVLYAGQLSKAKGVHTIIAALGRLVRDRDVNVRLDIAGSGVPEYVESLRAMVREGGLDDHVAFLGQVSHDRIGELHASHHVLVFSSEWEEPFGLAHLEAMASGCAVISTTTGGSAELIDDGRNALAYAAGDASALAACLRRLGTDETERQAMADRAREDVEARFSFDGYLDKVETLLKSATGAD